MKGKKNDFSLSFYEMHESRLFMEFVHSTEKSIKWANDKGIVWQYVNIYNRRSREFIKREYNPHYVKPLTDNYFNNHLNKPIMSDISIKGRIIEIGGITEGESKNGAWRKRTVVIEETDQKFNKKIAFDVWGDLVDSELLVKDKEIVADLNLESRKHNEKWYNDNKAWRVTAP